MGNCFKTEYEVDFFDWMCSFTQDFCTPELSKQLKEAYDTNTIEKGTDKFLFESFIYQVIDGINLYTLLKIRQNENNIIAITNKEKNTHKIFNIKKIDLETIRTAKIARTETRLKAFHYLYEYTCNKNNRKE